MSWNVSRVFDFDQKLRKQQQNVICMKKNILLEHTFSIWRKKKVWSFDFNTVIKFSIYFLVKCFSVSSFLTFFHWYKTVETPFERVPLLVRVHKCIFIWYRFHFLLNLLLLHEWVPKLSIIFSFWKGKNTKRVYLTCYTETSNQTQ